VAGPPGAVGVLPAPCADGTECGDWAGQWYWLRSPEQEKRVVASLYNRYCVRCHAVDGRGVWDIPDVPDFTNARWQAHRSDARLARLILEGRGAVMPAFRGTLTLEEAWAMARYLRTFVPGTEASRPDEGKSEKSEKSEDQLPAPKPGGPAAAPGQPPARPTPQR
jgi:mono/diheme cytochrome c family protein